MRDYLVDKLPITTHDFLGIFFNKTSAYATNDKLMILSVEVLIKRVQIVMHACSVILPESTGIVFTFFSRVNDTNN